MTRTPASPISAVGRRLPISVRVRKLARILAAASLVAISVVGVGVQTASAATNTAGWTAQPVRYL